MCTAARGLQQHEWKKSIAPEEKPQGVFKLMGCWRQEAEYLQIQEPTETHRSAVLKILRGLATEDIAYISYTCKWEHVSSLYIPIVSKISYPHQCYLNVKVALHHEEPLMQETTGSGMSNPFASIEPEIQEATRSEITSNETKCFQQVKRSTRSCNLTIPSMYQKTSQIQQHLQRSGDEKNMTKK